MGQTVAELVDRYPVMTLNYRVTIGKDAIGFTEVTGLKREFEHVTYRHGLSFLEGESIVRYHMDRYEPITMKRGVFRKRTKVSIAEDKDKEFTLSEWLEDRGTIAYGLVDNPVAVFKLGPLSSMLRPKVERSITIDLYDAGSKADAKRGPVVTWTVAKAIPVKLEAPGFSAGAAEAAIETLEVMAAGITVKYH